MILNICALAIVGVAIGVVAAHYVACALSFVGRSSRREFLNVRWVASLFLLVILAGYVARGVGQWRWGYQWPLGSGVVASFVVAYAVWVVLSWWHGRREEGTNSRDVGLAASAAVLSGIVLGGGIDGW